MIVKARTPRNIQPDVPQAPATASIDGHRRWKQLRLNIAAGGAARLTAGLCALVQVAFLTRALGMEGYGLWVTLLSLAGFITFFDGGVGVNIETALAEASSHGDQMRLRAVFSSGFLTLTVFAGFYLLLASISLPWIDWTGLLQATERWDRDARLGALIVAVLFIAGVPLNIAPRLAGALQIGRVAAAWTALGSVLSVCLAALAALFRWPWLAVVTVLSLVPLLQNAGLLMHLWRRLGWPVEAIPPLPWAEWRTRIRKTLHLSVPQLGQSLLLATPPFTVAAVGGPAAATAFNLIQRLATPLQQVIILFLTPLWPTYVEARSRGDVAWLVRMLRWSTIAALVAAGVLAGLVALRDPLLLWWAGASVEVPVATFAWAAALWFGLNLLALPLSYFLVGISAWRPLCLSAIVGQGAALTALVGLSRAESSPATQLLAASAGLAGLWLPGLAWAIRSELRAPSSKKGAQ